MPANSNGEVTLVIRTQAETMCPMDAKLYPFDAQECSIVLVPKSLASDKLQFRVHKWKTRMGKGDMTSDLGNSKFRSVRIW